jgi:hypothetical protein
VPLWFFFFSAHNFTVHSSFHPIVITTCLHKVVL